jgi:hypothetical protein
MTNKMLFKSEHKIQKFLRKQKQRTHCYKNWLKVMPNLSIMYIFKEYIVQALVAHTSNPSYSGSRDQEDRNSKPAWANSS